MYITSPFFIFDYFPLFKYNTIIISKLNEVFYEKRFIYSFFFIFSWL